MHTNLYGNSSSDAAKYGTGRPNGGTKQKKVRKRRTHKKFSYFLN